MLALIVALGVAAASASSDLSCHNDAEDVPGRCVPLADCPWTHTQSSPGFPYGFPQVCSFQQGQPLVCCPSGPGRNILSKHIHPSNSRNDGASSVASDAFSALFGNTTEGTVRVNASDGDASFILNDSTSEEPGGTTSAFYDGSSDAPEGNPHDTRTESTGKIDNTTPTLHGAPERDVSTSTENEPPTYYEESIDAMRRNASAKQDSTSASEEGIIYPTSIVSTSEATAMEPVGPTVFESAISSQNEKIEDNDATLKRIAEVGLPFETSWLTREETPAGPFDVTTILRLRIASSHNKTMRFHSDGDLEVHSRTNAAGLPFRVGGRAIGPTFFNQFPECTSYDPCAGWTATNWTRESSPGPSPPIRPRRVGGDPVTVGESVRIHLTAGEDGGTILIGLCGDRSCSVVQAIGVDEHNQLGYWTRIANTDDVRDDGPILEERNHRGFAPGKNYTFVVQRRTEGEMALWLESNPSDVVTVPLEPDRARLKFDSTAGAAYFLQDGEQRSDGDPVEVGHHVRVLVITSVDRGQKMWLGLCGENSCSVVKVVGVSQSLRMGYKTLYTKSSSLLDQDGDVLAQRGPTGFISRQRYVFVVHRVSPLEMAVWLEDNPQDKVVVPLRPDRSRLKVDSTSGPTFFIEDTVWTTRDRGGVLESPPLDPLMGKLCVSVVYMSSRKHSGIRLSARVGSAPPITMATITPDQEGGWRHSRVLMGVPGDILRRQWRLLVTAHRPAPEAPVLLQRVAGCNPWDEEDVAIIGRERVPYFQPGFNVSWASPRAGLPPTTQLSCANGGKLDEIGNCVCPPGFAGPLCLTACGFNRFGADCEGRCSRGANATRGCRGLLMCAPGMDCQCGAGLKGVRCDTPCDAGEYGAGCSQTCYLCKGGPCDPYSGICPEDKRPFCPSACGSATTGAEALVLDGEPVPVGGFPWHAAIYHQDPADPALPLQYYCGGALVMPNLVLSAAHCFYKASRSPPLLPAGEFFVALGKLLSGWNAEEASVVHKTKAKRILIPDTFVGISRNYDHDIALVELEDPVPAGTNITPICIDPAVILTAGDELQVAGWGSNAQPLDDLMFIRAPFIPSVQCLRRVANTFIRFITDDKICSFIDNGQALARGDSGGGLVLHRHGVWYLQGLVSNHHKNAFVFTNVLYHLRWMQDAFPLGCDSL